MSAPPVTDLVDRAYSNWRRDVFRGARRTCGAKPRIPSLTSCTGIFPLPAALSGIIPQDIGFGFPLPSLIVRILGTLPGLADNAMMWVIAGLIVDHGVSFLQHFILGREVAERTMQKTLFEPYPRVVFLHVVILAGAFLSIRAGSPAWRLPAIIAVKLTIDLVLHIRSHGIGRGTGRAKHRQTANR